MGLAVAFMWFLYPMHIDYSEVLRSGTFFYEANMLGPLPVGYDIPWRGDSFINDTNILGGDLDGGWITGGAAGADLPRAISPAHRVPTSSLPDCTENHRLPAPVRWALLQLVQSVPRSGYGLTQHQHMLRQLLRARGQSDVSCS